MHNNLYTLNIIYIVCGWGLHFGFRTMPLKSQERPCPGTTTTGGAKWKEEDMLKTLWPSVWLTEDFPLSIDEFLLLPGEPRARRAPAPRAAHHQVPTGDFPSKGNIALLLNKKPQNYIYFFISGFSG